MPQVRIFLSTVSREFRSYREVLRRDLDRANVTVKVQEDFVATGTETLDKLDDYIRECDAVLHLVGDMTGAMAAPESVAMLRRRYPDLPRVLPVVEPFLAPGAAALSYTQWEAWLALYHGKTLLIAVPHATAPRDEPYRWDEAEHRAQQAHLARLGQVERYPEIHFTNADRLAVEMLRSGLLRLLSRAGGASRPMNLPYRSLGERFTGRTDLMARLDALLRPREPGAAAARGGPAQPVVLCGLSGVGKTRAALEYAWMRQASYTAVLFVAANSPQALQANLAALSRPSVLDLPEKADPDETKQFEAVLRWLHQHPGWLLILDNLDSEDDAQAVQALLPRLTDGHVLVTSQLSRWGGEVQAISVDALGAEPATELLLARTAGQRRPQPDDAEQARQLADELGHLPLALEQAAAYIATRRLGFAQYRAQWQQQREEVLAWFDPRLMACDQSLAMTAQTALLNLSPEARALMQRLAWLEPAPAPETLLDVPIDTGAPDSAFDAWTALRELDGQCLVNWSVDAPVFTVNRLMQDITRRLMTPDERAASLSSALTWIRAAWTSDPEDVGSWPVLEPLLPHALGLARRADEAGRSEAAAWLKVNCGWLLYRKGRYAEVEPLARQALAQAQALYPQGHLQIAECLELMGEWHGIHQQGPAALDHHQRALALREALQGPRHLEVADTLERIGSAYWKQADYPHAEHFHLRALAIREQALGVEHARVAASLGALAATYNMQGDFTRAKPLLERTLAMQERTLGPENGLVASTLNNLAYLYVQGSRDHARAGVLFERAIAIMEKAFGPMYPDLHHYLTNLAHCYEETAPEKVPPVVERALAIRESAFGPDHPDVARSLRDLARVRIAQGRGTEAVALGRRALAIEERLRGPVHDGVALSLEWLAEHLDELGETAEALALYQRALAIREALEPGSQNVADTRQRMNGLRAKLGRR